MVQQHDSLRDIHVGQDIISADGEKIGTVDSVVLNVENRHLEQIVAGQGIFSQPKLMISTSLSVSIPITSCSA